MLNIFKTRRALLAEIAELRAENGSMRAIHGAQCSEIWHLKQQITDREALLIAAYERLAKAQGPKRNAKGQFVGAGGMISQDYAAFLDRKGQIESDGGFEPIELPDFLFPFQKELVSWGVRKGRGALFEDVIDDEVVDA